MVRIRLARTGGKKHATYRIVASDGRSPRDGRFIEQIGFYDPNEDPAVVRVDGERIRYWLGVGARPSVTVRHLLAKVPPPPPPA